MQHITMYRSSVLTSQVRTIYNLRPYANLWTPNRNVVVILVAKLQNQQIEQHTRPLFKAYNKVHRHMENHFIYIKESTNDLIH